MWGAIIGDIAGSIYEYDQITKGVSPVSIETLIQEKSFYSDDTILTIAVMDAILNDKNYSHYLRKYGRQYKNYKPQGVPFFDSTFSPRFQSWIQSDEIGTNIGNGAMMRISSVGYLFDTEEDVRENAKNATIPSHHSQEAIECATTIALIIFYARKGYTKEQIIEKLHLKIEYKPFTEFNGTCYKTIGNFLYAVFTSNSYEEALKKVISYGGDTDTDGSIVGGMAEAFFGVDEQLILAAKEKLPIELLQVVEKAYQRIK